MPTIMFRLRSYRIMLSSVGMVWLLVLMQCMLVLAVHSPVSTSSSSSQKSVSQNNLATRRMQSNAWYARENGKYVEAKRTPAHQQSKEQRDQIQKMDAFHARKKENHHRWNKQWKQEYAKAKEVAPDQRSAQMQAAFEKGKRIEENVHKTQKAYRERQSIAMKKAGKPRGRPRKARTTTTAVTSLHSGGSNAQQGPSAGTSPPRSPTQPPLSPLDPSRYEVPADWKWEDWNVF